MNIFLSLFFAAVFVPAISADKYTEIAGLPPVPSYNVKNTKDKISVDGKLTEKAWAKATPVVLMFP